MSRAQPQSRHCKKVGPGATDYEITSSLAATRAQNQHCMTVRLSGQQTLSDVADPMSRAQPQSRHCEKVGPGATDYEITSSLAAARSDAEDP